MKIKSLINWKLFGILLAAGILGTIAIFPFILTLQGDALSELPLAIPIVLMASLAQTAVFLSIAIFIGLLLGKKVGLGTPIISNWLAGQSIKTRLKSVGLLSVKLGVLAGVLIIGFDLIFSLFIEPITAITPPVWQGFLASFYGGIVEEILMRLFLVTTLVWIMWKLTKRSDEERPSSSIVWIAIFSAAVVFGLGHLPATAALTALTPVIIFRAVLLNGIGGIIFGWLFWKKGLEAAIIAHFSADIVLHVILTLILIYTAI